MHLRKLHLLTERHLHAGGAQLPQHDLDSTAFKAVQFKAKVLSFNTRTGFASAQIQVCTTDVWAHPAQIEPACHLCSWSANCLQLCVR